MHMDATMNLTVPRGDKSVWDRPSLTTSLATCDRERWLTAACGSVLAMAGARRGGFSGGLVAMAGTVLAVRAAMGRHDLHVAGRLVDRALHERGWHGKDPVMDASEGSFPASESPAWTAVSGAATTR